MRSIYIIDANQIFTGDSQLVALSNFCATLPRKPSSINLELADGARGCSLVVAVDITYYKIRKAAQTI